MEMLQLNDLHKTSTPARSMKSGPERCQPAHGSRGLCHHRGLQRCGQIHLFNAITGGFIADEGSILLGGQDITFEPEHQRSKVIGTCFRTRSRARHPT